MFPSTQPMHPADSRPPPAAHTALSSLSPSLLQDLLRFENSGPQRELLEVLAACVRHTQALAITVAAPDQPPLVLSVFPTDRQVHCVLPLADVLGGNLAALQVLEVQPARWRAPRSTEAHRIDHPDHYAPLGPLLWAVALRGAPTGCHLASAWAGSPCPARWPSASPACAATPATCARSPAGPTWARSGRCGC